MQMMLVLIWLALGVAVFPQQTIGEQLEPAVFTEEDTGEFISVAGADPFTALGTILHLDTKHLAALGIGIVFGATVITQQLEVGEIAGILVGVIAGDLLYRAFLSHKKQSWLPEDLF